MLQARVKTAFHIAALSVAATLGLVGSAHAAVYTGNWDPAYGLKFPDLGWKASATFDVPAACLGQGDGLYLQAGNCAGFSVLSAQLDFYNFTIDPNPSTSPIVQSFSLDPGVFVNGINIVGGQLVGVNTGYFSAVVPTNAGAVPIAGGGAYSFSLILFNGNQAQLIYAKPVTASPLCASGFGSEGDDCGFSSNAPVGVFAPIPEPGTYALMLAGLGVMGFVARRRGR